MSRWTLFYQPWHKSPLGTIQEQAMLERQAVISRDGTKLELIHKPGYSYLIKIRHNHSPQKDNANEENCQMWSMTTLGATSWISTARVWLGTLLVASPLGVSDAICRHCTQIAGVSSYAWVYNPPLISPAARQGCLACALPRAITAIMAA